jgi:hypothetical protein
MVWPSQGIRGSTLFLKCTNWYTFLKIAKISMIHVTFLVGYFCVLHRIRYCSIVLHAKNSLLSLQEALPLPLELSSYTKPTHHTQPLPISSPPPPPPSTTSTTMTDVYHYNTNVTKVYPIEYNDKWTDSFDAEDEMPDFLKSPRTSRVASG